MRRKFIGVLGCLLLLGACSTKPVTQEEKKPTDSKPEATKEVADTAALAVTPTPEAPTTPPAGDNASLSGSMADLTKYTPPGAELGIYIEVAKFKKGPLWERFGPLLEMMISSDKEYTEFVAKSGWDPMKSIEAAYFSFRNMDAPTKPEGIAVLRATYDASLLSAALEKEAGVTKETHAGVTIYLIKKDLALSFVAPGLILGGDLAEVKKALDNSKTPMEGSKEMEAMLQAADSSKALVMGVAFSDEMRKEAAREAPFMASVVGVFGHLDFASGLEMKGGIRFGSEADASTAKAEVDKVWAEQKKMAEAMGFGRYLTGVSWEAKGNDFLFSWVMNAADTMALADQVMAMAGGMMGAGGGALPTPVPPTLAPPPAPPAPPAP